MFSAVNDYTMGFLKAHVKRDPENAWFRMVKAKFDDGNMVPGLELLNPLHFPKDRLPTSSDRCNGNMWQHEWEPKNVNPCPGEGETHPTVDYRLAVKLAAGEL